MRGVDVLLNLRETLARWLAVLAVIPVMACASATTIPVSENLSPTSDKGLMLVSVAYSGGYSGYSMHFRKVGEEKWQSLTIGASIGFLPPGMLDWDIEEPGLRGQTFAVRLAPGDYEFFSWYVGSGAFYTRPVNNFSIGFSVDAASTYYVGRFTFLKQRGVGASVTGVNVQHSDQWAADREIFSRKYPDVSLGELRQVASGIQLSEYLGDGNSTSLIISPVLHNLNQ